MKKYCFSIIVIAVFAIGSTKVFATPFSSPTVGGPTGIITAPTAQIGWDGNDTAFDVAGNYISADNEAKSKSLKFNASLFRRLELGLCEDFQSNTGREKDDDLLAHAKFRFYPWNNVGKSALAIGGKYMMMNYDSDDKAGEAPKYHNQQIYLAATYGGDFFSMPAETTFVIGKTWGKYTRSDDIDFAMGFDLDLLPSILKGYVHFISDFGNFSYSPEPIGSIAATRGAFNFGGRIAVLKDMNRLKFNIDALMLDALDDNHCWGLGAAFGMAF